MPEEFIPEPNHPLETQTGSIFTLHEIDPHSLDQYSPTRLIGEIENHFEVLLGRKNVSVAVHNAFSDEVSRRLGEK